MLSAAEKAAIRESWTLMEPVADAAADLFYQRLVQAEPGLWPASHAQLASQKRDLVRWLGQVVQMLDWDKAAWREDVPDDRDLFLVLLGMGRRNEPLARLVEEHYGTVGDALIGALGFTLGPRFDAATRSAWSRLYTLLANAIRLGRLSASAPAESQPVPTGLPSVAQAEPRGAAS